MRPRRYGPWSHRRRWPSGEHPPWNRYFFIRFLLMLFSFSLLLLGGGTLITYRLATWLSGNEELALATWVQACAGSFLLVLLAFVVARRLFRRTVTPAAEILTAVSEVADGNLTIELPDYGRGEFGELGRAFNRMVQELQRAELQRQNLTADVAHELRTPLHIIQGNLEGILDGVYEPDEAHLAATLEETQALARLVEDLQTLSLAEGGQLRLVREQVSLAELLLDVQTSFSGQAEVAGITLQVALPAGADTWRCHGDPGRLNQVLSILLMNGIRHTPAGGQLNLSLARENGDFRLTVSDTGEGIPPADLPHIFDRFWRGDRARTHQAGAGAGLGLSIARQLVLAHGGTIDASSAVGAGTTFTITLPAEPTFDLN